MRSMLGAGRWCVLKSMEGFGDVAWHGDVDVLFGIVPIDGQTTIFTSCPLDGDMVGLLKGLDEMQGIIVAKVLDAEIIDCKGERGRE